MRRDRLARRGSGVTGAAGLAARRARISRAVSGAGRDCCFASEGRAGDVKLGCRKCGGNGGKLDSESFLAHLAALGGETARHVAAHATNDRAAIAARSRIHSGRRKRRWRPNCATAPRRPAGAAAPCVCQLKSSGDRSRASLSAATLAGSKSSRVSPSFPIIVTGKRSDHRPPLNE